MMRNAYPILEFDPQRSALIEPQHFISPVDVPIHCILCFFHDVMERFAKHDSVEIVTHLGSEMGKIPVLKYNDNKISYCAFHIGVGAPLAAALLEELIALGCRKFIVCGSAGVLDSSIVAGHPVIPVSAIRDEGTSYHYLPPSREVEPHPNAIQAIQRILKTHHINFLTGKTWTTDAPYRETPGKVKLRREEGCLTVEMEAAALFAVAQFRGVELGQILYGGDDLGGDEWDSRNWTKLKDTRDKLFQLAIEACLQM